MFNIIIVISCFITINVIKICNTIFNINKMKYTNESAKILSSSYNVKDLEKLYEVAKEGNKNENSK